jgi:hypothetical protein
LQNTPKFTQIEILGLKIYHLATPPRTPAFSRIPDLPDYDEKSFAFFPVIPIICTFGGPIQFVFNVINKARIHM